MTIERTTGRDERGNPLPPNRSIDAPLGSTRFAPNRSKEDERSKNIVNHQAPGSRRFRESSVLETQAETSAVTFVRMLRAASDTSSLGLVELGRTCCSEVESPMDVQPTVSREPPNIPLSGYQALNGTSRESTRPCIPRLNKAGPRGSSRCMPLAEQSTSAPNKRTRGSGHHRLTERDRQVRCRARLGGDDPCRES